MSALLYLFNELLVFHSHLLTCSGLFFLTTLISNPFIKCLFGAPSHCPPDSVPQTPAEGGPPSALPLLMITLQTDFILLLYAGLLSNSSIKDTSDNGNRNRLRK